MGPEIVNKLRDSEIHGDFVGRDNISMNIILFQDSEREFVVTHNANIKPVSYFTGREAELQELRQRIEDGRKSVLVSGMGGIGKTHICRKLFEEYLNRHADGGNCPFKHIGYIEYNGDMGSSLQRYLKFKRQDRPEKNQEAAWRELEYLASGGRLLLFVDNVNMSLGEDPNLKRLMGIPGAIVLTSRRRVFSKEFEPYRIGFLSTEKCRKIYEKIRFENSDTKVAEEEVSDLEYIIDTLVARHTITVELLAHLAWTKQWTVQELRDELEENGFRLEYMDDEDKLVNIQESYETLYDISVLTEAEQNILEAFSIFPYIPLEAEVCNRWLLADAGVSEDEDILVGLYRKGWLQFDIEQESYALHPIFAQFIYEKTKPSAEMHSGLIELLRSSLKIPKNGSALVCQNYIPFAESIIRKADMGSDMKRAEFISTFAYLLQYIAAYKKAEKLYKELLNIRRNVLDEDHLKIAESYNNLAYVYQKQREYEKAEELYKKSLKIRKSALGEEHLEIARSCNNLATMYAEWKRYEKAEEWHKKALKILGKESEDNLVIISRSYTNLAYVYEQQGKYKKAEVFYKKGLKIRKNVLGEKHLEVANSYNNIAYLYGRQGKYKIALIYYLKAYNILILKHKLSHPYIQLAYKNMKSFYTKWNPEGNFEQWLEENMTV